MRATSSALVLLLNLAALLQAQTVLASSQNPTHNIVRHAVHSIHARDLSRTMRTVILCCVVGGLIILLGIAIAINRYRRHKGLNKPLTPEERYQRRVRMAWAGGVV